MQSFIDNLDETAMKAAADFAYKESLSQKTIPHSEIVSKVKKTDRTAKLNQAMALMDTMMVKGGMPVPADADGLDILTEEKYSL